MRTKRIHLIEEYITKEKSASLDDLCKRFSVSKNTIRRDIDYLVKKDVVKKVYGGVELNTKPSLNSLTSFDERFEQNASQKDAIARKAAELVEDNDTIFIDTGTTCPNMIHYLVDKTCIVITNSLQIAVYAIHYPNIKVVMLPGILQSQTRSFVGTSSEKYLKDFNINKAFMACTGISLEKGITNSSFEEYTIKKTVIQNTKKCYLLADSSKFGKTGMMTFAKFSDFNAIISNGKPDKTYTNKLKQSSIDYIEV